MVFSVIVISSPSFTDALDDSRVYVDGRDESIISTEIDLSFQCVPPKFESINESVIVSVPSIL